MKIKENNFCILQFLYVFLHSVNSFSTELSSNSKNLIQNQTFELPQVRYDGYKVFKLVLKSEDHIPVLKNLENHEIPFWGLSTYEVGGGCNVILAPHQQSFLLEGLINSGIEVTELHSDVQRLLDSQIVKNDSSGYLNWNSYYRLNDIYQFLRNQESYCKSLDPPKVSARVGSIGKTFEGREILFIKISFDDQKSPEKRAILIDSNIHAKEWITSAVSTYLINELVNNRNNSEIQSWTKDFDWYFIPVLNPDGFEYTHTKDRFWRKNRSIPNKGKTLSCPGVDLNRNFGFHWNETGTSGDSCSNSYAGISAFSEPETVAFARFVNDLKYSGVDIAAYFSLHSYSQSILLPFSYLKKGDRFPQYEKYMDIATQAAKGHAKLFGTNFTAGTFGDLLYPGSGCSDDWMAGVHKVPISLIYELRDKGHFAHYLPTDQIVPSALEFIEGLKVYVRELKKGTF